MNNWIEIVKDRNFHFHRISSLVILMVLVMGAMIGLVLPYFASNFPITFSPLIQVILLLVAELALIIYWYYYRSVYPLKRGSKQNIVVAIITENQKQKTRISNDFVANIKNQLKEYSILSTYDIVVLHNAHSTNLKNTIERISKNHDGNQVDKNRLDNIIQRMNARFIIYGNLVTRNSPNNRYQLKLEALIRHKTPKEFQKKVLQEGFKTLWENEISFLEEEEITGFKSTSDQVFFAATYMIGLASYIDLKYEKGIEINKQLIKYIDDNEKYVDFKPKVVRLLSSSYFMFSRVLYFNGNYEKSIEIRRKFHELTPDEYDAYLSEAIFHVNKRNDPETAMEFIEKAEVISRGNGTWKYSKLYLLILLNRYHEALNTLDAIISSTFDLEIDIINQVITYNTHCLEKDSSHIQSYFIIGVLIYKKLGNPTLAYDKLQEFINKSGEFEEWQILKNRVEEYLAEIDELIGIKKINVPQQRI